MKRILLSILLVFTICALQAQEVKKVLCIGNSFTYYHDSYKILAELAQSEGYKLDVNAQFVGGYNFHRHLNRDETMATITYNKFDYVFLQDQSQRASTICSSSANHLLLLQVLADTMKLLVLNFVQ